MSDYQRLENHQVHIDNCNYEWLEKNYPGFLHTIFMQGIHAGVYEAGKKYDFAFRNGYSFNGASANGKQEIDWFWDLRELRRVRELFVNKCKINSDFINKLHIQWETDHKANIKVYELAETIDFSKLTDEELFNWYEKLYHANIRQGATGYLADAFLSSGEQDWLIDFITNRVGKRDDLPEIMEILASPTI